jgi:hypothetical protein
VTDRDTQVWPRRLVRAGFVLYAIGVIASAGLYGFWQAMEHVPHGTAMILGLTLTAIVLMSGLVALCLAVVTAIAFRRLAAVDRTLGFLPLGVSACGFVIARVFG